MRLNTYIGLHTTCIISLQESANPKEAERVGAKKGKEVRARRKAKKSRAEEQNEGREVIDGESIPT